jgi:NAD(P)-dependent dehydrogenase (short-subunit alcohol dehydrogenase family)
MTTSIQGKIVLITGGTGGIGKETAIELARLGAQVVVTGRDKIRSEAGVADIRRQSGQANIDLLLADLSKQSEIHWLAENFMAKYARLDVLINNLGGLYADRWETEDGIEATLAVNHLTPFLLNRLLLPILKASAPARIINVTGGMPSTKLDLTNLQGENRFLALQNYSQAKVVMMAGAYEQARQLEGSGVTLNVAYPGAASTAMTQAMTPAMVPWFMKLAWPLFGRIMAKASPAKAARSSVYLASSPEVAGVNGKYYDTNSNLAKWPKAVLDENNRRFIWELSEQLIKSSVPSVGRAS